VRTHYFVSRQETPPQDELVRERRRCRRRLVLNAHDPLCLRHHGVYFRLARLKGYGGERLLDPLGQLAHRPGRWLLTRREGERIHGERLAKIQERRAAEGALRAVIQPGRDDHDRWVIP